MARKNHFGVYLAAGLLFVGGLGWLIVSSISESSTYFLNVGEALSMDPAKLTSIRMFGTVSDGQIEIKNGGLGADFVLVDKDDHAKTIRVAFAGAVPDTLKAGTEVIVEGGIDPARGVFGAKTLMTKCPSKYQKENRG